jgi:hypothetical protein
MKEDTYLVLFFMLRPPKFGVSRHALGTVGKPLMNKCAVS